MVGLAGEGPAVELQDARGVKVPGDTGRRALEQRLYPSVLRRPPRPGPAGVETGFSLAPLNRGREVPPHGEAHRVARPSLPQLLFGRERETELGQPRVAERQAHVDAAPGPARLEPADAFE